MKHSRMTAASFAAVFNPLAVLSPLAISSPLVGIAASPAGALPARAEDVPFTEQVISTTADNARSVFATDLDGDGDTDVLSASQNDNKVAWYESDGGSPPTFTERVISTTADSANFVLATDVDGDGDIDVLSASVLDDKIAWYENTTPRCGDGLLGPDEACDDGNTADRDGCSSTCEIEEVIPTVFLLTGGKIIFGGRRQRLKA